MIDWRFIISKRINRKWERGFCVTWDTIFDQTEDFAKPLILSKGDLFIDAGAHCGFWTLQASKYYNTIIAIEPSPRTAKSLRTNLRTNRITNVQVIEAALSDKVGIAEFYEWPDGPMGNSLYSEPVTYSTDYGIATKHYPIRTISIDSLREEPTVIKLDIEGAEYDAVRGGMKTILRNRPKLFIEIHQPQNVAKIRAALPGYEWVERSRVMEPFGKQAFKQIQLMGQWEDFP